MPVSVNDPISITKALIRCRSVTPAASGALDVLQEVLERSGFRCTRMQFSEEGTADVDNLFARIGDGRPHFCFAGHVDVVPPGDEAAWTHPPFSAAERDGRLWGRGAVDMKGAVACFAAAAAQYLEEKGGLTGGSISLLITGDEEGPSINGTAKVLRWMADNGHVPDHCLVGEPTNPDALGDAIKIGRRGSLNGVLTIIGIQGHSAYPERALNPIPRLVRILDRLASEPLDRGSKHFQPSSLEITSVDVGNPATNVIPARATARFNIRFNDLHTADSLRRRIEDCCAAVTASMGGTYELDFASTGDCFLTEPGPLVDIVRDAVRRRTGREPALSTSGGTSDARFIKDYCPVVEFGLVGRTMHQVDENVAVADLEKLTDIYRSVLALYFERMAA